VPFASGAPKSFAAASCGSAAGDSNSPWGRACSTATAAAALLHRGKTSSAAGHHAECWVGRWLLRKGVPLAGGVVSGGTRRLPKRAARGAAVFGQTAASAVWCA
jgi:hypothetical protein